jgi:hypothetical protein
MEWWWQWWWWGWRSEKEGKESRENETTFFLTTTTKKKKGEKSAPSLWWQKRTHLGPDRPGQLEPLLLLLGALRVDVLRELGRHDRVELVLAVERARGVVAVLIRWRRCRGGVGGDRARRFAFDVLPAWRRRWWGRFSHCSATARRRQPLQLCATAAAAEERAERVGEEEGRRGKRHWTFFRENFEKWEGATHTFLFENEKKEEAVMMIAR